MNHDRFHSLVIDADAEARVRLRQAMVSVSAFGKSAQCSSLSEGLKYLHGSDDPVDIVFLSYRVAGLQLSTFAKAARATDQGSDSTIVITIPTSTNAAESVLKNVLSGVDGVLVEPFSVDSLSEILTLTKQVKRRRQEERTREAVRIVVAKAVEQLDVVWKFYAQHLDLGVPMRKFRELTEISRGLPPDERVQYFAQLIEAFTSIEAPPERPAVQKYSGASARIRRKMEERMAAQLRGGGSASDE